MIQINNISKIYRKGTEVFTALDNVSLCVKKGEFIAISGPSGAGKSTLLNVIGGLIHPDSGDILFNNRDIYKQKNRETDEYRKKHIGFMFQQFHLMPYLTVLENIRLGFNEKSGLKLAYEYMEKCSLISCKNKYPSELSVGEKQRTAFIRAIISAPDILLADEPTGNLDPANSNILMLLIEDFHKNGGTVILVSHETSSLRFSSMNIKLERGRIQ